MALQDPSSLQTIRLGDFTLESGEVIPDLRMSFIAHGTLSPARDNAILSIHGLVADHDQLTSWVGTDAVLDPSRYYIIQVDSLAVVTEDPALSTSPSRSGLGMRFPRFTIRDMVAAEHRLLTQGLGIDHLVAVTGVSFGAIETLQWGVSFPTFMDAIMPVTPAAHLSRSTALLMETARRAIMLDPKWRDGDYPSGDPPREGVLTGLLVQALYGGSAAGFEERFDDGDAVRRFYVDQSRALAAHADARDWIYRTWAADSHDIAGEPRFGGDLAMAAAAIEARVLVIVNSRDQLLPPHESGVVELMHYLKDAKLVDFDDLGGHYAHRRRSGMALMATEMRDLLDRIDRGKPGFAGPKYPRHWSRAQVAPQG